MSDELLEGELFGEEEESQLTRRGLFVTGGLAAAGLTALGSPASRAFAAATASPIKVAVVTHGDTGSFWSVFKRGVDQAKKDLKSRGVSVTQVYANNDVPKQVAGINAAIAAGANVIATSVPNASRPCSSMQRSVASLSTSYVISRPEAMSTLASRPGTALVDQVAGLDHRPLVTATAVGSSQKYGIPPATALTGKT